jgi:thiamine-phosphate pyrophosphorylase
MLRYAITSRILFPGDDSRQKTALLHQCARWATDDIDFIQLREKDLPAADLVTLARAILKTLPSNSKTRLLINSRADIAIATQAHGVHLTAAPGELIPDQIRELYAKADCPNPIISISCHTLAEVQQARANKVDAILFAPVFGKFAEGSLITSGLGLDQLHAASLAASPIPIYALGGVSHETAPACIAAGATGIAGIRLFHDDQKA